MTLLYERQRRNIYLFFFFFENLFEFLRTMEINWRKEEKNVSNIFRVDLLERYTYILEIYFVSDYVRMQQVTC